MEAAGEAAAAADSVRSEGSGEAPVAAAPGAGVTDDETFKKAVLEHAAYLGLVLPRDERFLWCVKHSVKMRPNNLSFPLPVFAGPSLSVAAYWCWQTSRRA